MIVYKLFSPNLTTHNGFRWTMGEWSPVEKLGKLCEAGGFHWYHSPEIAEIRDCQDGSYGRVGIMCECEADGPHIESAIKGKSARLRPIRQVERVIPTTAQRVRAAIYMVQAAMPAWPDSPQKTKWTNWATNWLSGADRTAAAARSAAARAAAWAAEAAAEAAAWAAAWAAAADRAAHATLTDCIRRAMADEAAKVVPQ